MRDKAAMAVKGRWGYTLPEDGTHAGLAYDMYAPTVPAGDKAGAVPDDDRPGWFDALEGIRISKDYRLAYHRWRDSLRALGARIVEVEATSRLLIGHGNPSGAEVGLTVQHTWGTPVLPGSSLKGILHHALVRKYGPADSDDADPARALYRDVVWEDRRIRQGPGAAIRWLFGAPDADGDATERESSPGTRVGAARGRVTFLDAWMVADSAGVWERPFARDVLTVHQRGYYGQTVGQGGRAEPNDYDAPVPVSFLTIRPGVRFLVAVLSDDPSGRGFAIDELLCALADHGVGGKTQAGYGQLEATGEPKTLKPELRVKSELLDTFKAFLNRERDAEIPSSEPDGPTLKEVWGYIRDTLVPQIQAAEPLVRQAAAEALKKSKFSKNRRSKAEAESIRKQLEQE